MRVPLSWLNDYVKIDDIETKRLADSFLSIGFEVEEIIDNKESFKNIVTGKVLSQQKHSNADNLSVLSIDVAKKDAITIVTGAKNVSVGDIVPVALTGSVVAGGKVISDTDFRGVVSHGMLCSGKELDIDDNTIEGAEVDGILILPKKTEIGINIALAIGIGDTIFDISINSNRPDCNSILGLAREIAVKLGRKVKMPQLSYKTVESKIGIPTVNIQDKSLCSRYHGNIIEDVSIQASPIWMRRRLILAGVRPINCAVDITNYVLLEIGQPLHAFDFDKVEGDIYIRTAKKNESLIALNETEYKLDQSMLLIADSKKALAIAGVMGGHHSAISEKTQSIFLESARFVKTTVRYTARKLGLRSDSSARYERGVDYTSVDLGRERALSLFDELKVGKIVERSTYSQIDQPKNKTIKTSQQEINSILGISVPEKEMIRVLEGLGFDVKSLGNGGFECVVPLQREDIDNFTDLAEEVIRFYGYHNVNSTNMEGASLTRGEIPLSYKNIAKIKGLLCGAGLYEIINFSFIGAGDVIKLNLSPNDQKLKQIKITNPLGEDRAYMRTQLVSSMLRTLQLNLSRQNESVALFEIAKVFISSQLPPKKLPYEPNTLCIGLMGKQYDFYYLKNIVANLLELFSVKFDVERSNKGWLHSGISADIIVNKKSIGSFGKVHPSVAKNFEASEDIFILELDLEEIINREQAMIRVQPLPKYPAVDRDLAVVAKSEINAKSLIDCIREAGKEYLESVKLFDVYAGGQIEAGYKSVAFSLRIRDKESTLQDAKVQAIMTDIVDSLSRNFGVKLR